MIRRLLMTCALVVMGAAAMAPKANAQSIDVPFSGTVGGNCTFSDVTPGKLGVNSSTRATTLAAGYRDGVMGKVSVTCNRSSSLRVSKPVQTSGPSFTPTRADGYVDSPVGSTTSSSSSGLRISSIGRAIPLEVDMKGDKGATLAPGTYGFKTTLTVTPQ